MTPRRCRAAPAVHDRTRYDDHGVTLLPGQEATDVDLRSGTVTTAGGASVPFDRVVLATSRR